MIPKNIRPGATAEGLSGETRQFTIKANGKAFRSMIDSLYSNKVLAVVRELCSNANDSHIAAGQTKPFLVQIPTNLDPVFSVRDFGIGLSHDDVMVMYTTIFESTNEDRNDTTGSWGLGSKSPFAYGDSFSVVSYTGTEKRLYLCFLGTDGIPCITHVGNEDCDEPRGLEVSFAAKRESIRQFQKEMRFVAMGYDVPPTVEGMELALPEPRLSGNGWAIYPAGEFVENDAYSRHFIRMGSALYPSNRSFPNLGGGFVSVTQIPIGSADVTSSRDALSYDSDTEQVVADAMRNSYAELKAQMEADVAKATTRRQVAAAWGKYRGILTNLSGTSMVSLRNDNFVVDSDESDEDPAMFVSQPGSVLQAAFHYGKAANARRTSSRYVSGLEVDHLDKLTVVVDDLFNKTVRRRARINRTGQQATGIVYVFTAHDERELKSGLAWITECFELKPEQFLKVSDITDIPPERKVRADGTRAYGPRRLAPGQYWMRRNGGYVQSEIFGTSYRRGTYEWPSGLRQAMSTSGIDPDWNDIFWVTDKQITSMTKRKGNLLPANRRLDTACVAMIERKAKKAPVAQAIERTTIEEMVGHYNDQVALIIEKFFPHVRISRADADAAINLAQNAKIALPSREIRDRVSAKIKELTEIYPLLFQRNERRHFEQYIDIIQAQKEAATA